MFKRLSRISFRDNLIVIGEFKDGKIVSYDFKQLFSKYPIFKQLEMDKTLFFNGKIAPGGCGIIFNDDIDIAAEELYYYGTVIQEKEDEDLNSRIAKLFSYERNRKGITQSELAKITGIHQAEISKIERGIGNPSIKTLERMAIGLGLKLELFLK